MPHPDPEIRIHSLGGLCPVQAEGTIDGEPFYFRSRGARWSIEIGPGNTGRVVEAMERAKRGTGGRASGKEGRRAPSAGEAASALPCWRYEEPYGVFPEAGYVTEEEACGFILRAARLWSASRKSG